jgi:hypothetical protein
LTDTVGLTVRGHVPALEGLMRYDTDGIRGSHVYVPWWLYDRKNDFPRGYHIELGEPASRPRRWVRSKAWRRSIRDLAESSRNASGRITGPPSVAPDGARSIPNEKSYCEIDPDGADEWGIPVLRFHFAWKRARAEAGRAYAAELHESAGDAGRDLDRLDLALRPGAR